jgi:predicted nuclease of predicted toxin-antitoxin system
MPKYLIDVPPPYFFSLWNTQDYIHQNDILNTAPDTEIWKYAKEKGLTILSKDADFSNRILLAQPPPRVIHIKIGNTSLKEFHSIIFTIWPTVLEMSDKYKLVTVLKDRIEAIE